MLCLMLHSWQIVESGHRGGEIQLALDSGNKPWNPSFCCSVERDVILAGSGGPSLRKGCDRVVGGYL